jgi:hypothetical protein
MRIKMQWLAEQAGLPLVSSIPRRTEGPRAGLPSVDTATDQNAGASE